MKNILSFFSFIALIATITLSSCTKNPGEICFDFAQSTTISTNPASAGPITVTKSLGTALNDQLTGKGVKIDNVNTVKVNAITITIPANAGYTFADISAAEVTVNGISLGKLPANATGLTQTFSTPSQSDFKAAFLGTTPASMVFTATYAKAITAASTLDVKIPLNTCYQLL
jgi:hypothetical protein